MSCGLKEPSLITSPLLTVSPSKTLMLLVLGIKFSLTTSSVPSLPVIMSLLLPLVSLPQETTPDSSAKIATSFGFLASKRSATLGNPPVISFVFEDSFGILAITSPTSIAWPSEILTKDFNSKM